MDGTLIDDGAIITTAPNMGQLYGALARARGEFAEIPKTRVATIVMKSGGKYSYRYADLADVFNAIDPSLAAYGLTVMQYPDAEGRNIITEVGHESGAFKVVTWPIKPMPQRNLDDAQSYQSAVQVAKRYALTAAIGVSTEETIEGDEKAHKVTERHEQAIDPYDHGDGVRMPHGAKWTKEMTKRQISEEAARAIEAQFDEVKAAVGVNGVWNRNETFIEHMKKNHDDLFQNIFDKFHALMAKYTEE
jgi:hypothetical protein